MAKQYKGSLELTWYKKQKAIIFQEDAQAQGKDEIAPRINWINQEEALFYEFDEKEGRGIKPYWVDRDDLRVREARPLLLQKEYSIKEVTKEGTILDTKKVLVENPTPEPIDFTKDNVLIKGDNLLALNTLRQHFAQLPDEQKVKCIYIDPPYNTGKAFENYDDNLAHSEWLTLMRDRLVILRELLKETGVIFIHLDDKEIAYCRVLLDQTFGRNNFINQIIMSTNSTFGFKGTANTLFKQANHILFYAKDIECFNINKVFIEKKYDKAYNLVFKDISLPEEYWEWENINEVVSKNLGYNSAKEAKKNINEDLFNIKVADFALKNANRVFQTAAVSGGALAKRRETIEKSKQLKEKVIRHPNDDMDYIFIGGRRVLFYNLRLQDINGVPTPVESLTDIWDDISLEGLSKEGNIDFPRAKKPEQLIQRIFDLTTSENDLILDCFGGSGTSFAVAQKMKRRWIGVETGNHAETHIIPRLCNVITGEDQSGISKAVNWLGGGSFKYCVVGESIIDFANNDFRWSLGDKFVQENLLFSYDYVVQDINTYFPTLVGEASYSIGFMQNGQKLSVGIAWLVNPEKAGAKQGFSISQDDFAFIYTELKRQLNPVGITLFTNLGIDITEAEKPEDVEIIKVPRAIFAELQR